MFSWKPNFHRHRYDEADDATAQAHVMAKTATRNARAARAAMHDAGQKLHSPGKAAAAAADADVDADGARGASIEPDDDDDDDDDDESELSDLDEVEDEDDVVWETDEEEDLSAEADRIAARFGQADSDEDDGFDGGAAGGRRVGAAKWKPVATKRARRPLLGIFFNKK